MAGIGFELKKMFHKKGLFAKIRAYGYAGIVCVGPMILGFSLLLMIRMIAVWGGATEHEAELLNCIVTYCLLASLIVTNTFSLLITRYIADQLYMERKQSILPSFHGSVSLMLILGETLFGIFLFFSGISFLAGFMAWIFFGELVVVWQEMNYLTAIKDYRGLMLTFLYALLISAVVAVVLILLGVPVLYAMLAAVEFGYGFMMVRYYILLTQYFPAGNTSCFEFLRWMDQYPQLVLVGFSITMGLFGHLVIMWTSSVRHQVEGLFYEAPIHDIPAIIAFFSILVTTVNFVTSVEVNFYETYRNYFSLFNDSGALMDIKQAEREMRIVLDRELSNTFLKQVFSTVIFVIGGSIVLPMLPLGMSNAMLGIFRVLCLGYAFYTIANCIMLIQLYFSDNTGAMISSVAYMLVSCIGTWIVRNQSIYFYGLGFLLGGIVFTFVGMFLLRRYLNRLMYHVLSEQPIVRSVYRGTMTKISEYFTRKYNEKYQIVGDENDE